MLFEKSRGPYRRIALPPFVAYTPIVLTDRPREADIHRHRSVIDALASFLEEEYHSVALHLQPSLTDVRTFSWSGWKIRPFYTYRLELGAFEPLLKSWSSSRRYDFRKNRDDYRVEKTDDVGAIIELCAESYERSGRTLPGGKTSIRSMVRTLVESGLAAAYTAVPLEETARPEAGTVILQHEEKAYYWLSGSRRGPAMTVLLGTLLERLSREGFHTFDMVGANTPSIAEFKRQFGPELVPYFRAEYIGRPELRLWHCLRS